MARVYIITEKELAELREGIERVKLRKVEHLETHDPQKALANDMFRSFNYQVCSWISEISKDQ